MEETNLTIKRVYDSYDHKDFSYGSEDSTNLNPKREISYDQLDRLVARLQEVTDDIIRKKISPKEEPEEVIRRALGGESLPIGIPFPKQKLIAQTGGFGNTVLFPTLAMNTEPLPLGPGLELKIGTFPASRLLNLLDEPPQLNCEEILIRFKFDDAEDFEDIDDVDDETYCEICGEAPCICEFCPECERSIEECTCPRCSVCDKLVPDCTCGAIPCDRCGEDPCVCEEDESATGGEGDDDDDVESCADREIKWLKIILILVRIIKILKMILDLVLSIIIPIIEIIQLAISVWINPPSVGVIIQKIIQIVVAIVVMLLTMLIQYIWNLLNMDCICDQTMSIIAQIRQALSAFSSIMSAFNPSAVNMLKDKLDLDLLGPLKALMEEANAKKEAWANIKNDFLDDIADIPGQMKQMGIDILKGAINTPEAGAALEMYSQAKSIFTDSLRSVMDAWEGIKEGAAMLTKSAATGEIDSPQFAGLTFMVND